MERAVLTNFLLWALAGAVLSYLLLQPDPIGGLLVAAGALLLAWRTPYRPEGLGLAAGVAAVMLVAGMVASQPVPYLLATLVIGAASYAVWRRPVAADGPSAGTVSAPARLSAATFTSAFVLLVLSGFLALAFGFRCEGDTAYLVEGTDKASYCHLLSDHGELRLLMLFGPAAITLVLGLLAARRHKARHLLMIVLGGLLLTIAVHAPDFAYLS